MNKYVEKTISNLQAAGFTVRAFADNEYFEIGLINTYSTYSLIPFKDGQDVGGIGGIYIVAANEGLEAISDYAIELESYIPKEDFDALAATSLVTIATVYPDIKNLLSNSTYVNGLRVTQYDVEYDTLYLLDEDCLDHSEIRQASKSVNAGDVLVLAKVT